jgi:predicted nucleic acid-binding protein
MADVVLDSGILIRHLRNLPGYPELVDRLADEGVIYISSFTRLEIVRGMRKYERSKTFRLLDSIVTVPMDSAIADYAGGLIFAWRAKGISLGDADAVIASTAVHLETDLITTNARHFPMPELIVWQADEVGQLELWERG